MSYFYSNYIVKILFLVEAVMTTLREEITKIEKDDWMFSEPKWKPYH